MNRRSFLTAMAAALVLDPERALWVPGKKLISIAAPPFDYESRFQTSLVNIASLGFDRYPAFSYYRTFLTSFGFNRYPAFSREFDEIVPCVRVP